MDSGGGGGWWVVGGGRSGWRDTCPKTDHTAVHIQSPPSVLNFVFYLIFKLLNKIDLPAGEKNTCVRLPSECLWPMYFQRTCQN